LIFMSGLRGASGAASCALRVDLHSGQAMNWEEDGQRLRVRVLRARCCQRGYKHAEAVIGRHRDRGLPSERG